MQSFEQLIQKICDKLSSDELINAMQLDSASKKLVNLRVYEIIQESIKDEKEQYIENMTWKMQQLKQENE